MTDLIALKERLESLSPAQRLFIASELMAKGKADIAVVIAENVVLEYQADKLFKKSWRQK